MQGRVMRIGIVVAAWFLCGGCTMYRQLQITEIAPDAVELNVAEPPPNRLVLNDHALNWARVDHESGQMTTGSIPLMGEFPAGAFVVVWMDSAYNGPPIPQDYVTESGQQVPGIKVQAGALPEWKDGDSGAFSVSGDHARGTWTDRVADLVRFGPQPRPPLDGAFHEDGSLNDARPQTGVSIARQWNADGTAPIDTDSESDFQLKPPSLGGPTPPPPQQ
jgi:hypothetical protein